MSGLSLTSSVVIAVLADSPRRYRKSAKEMISPIHVYLLTFLALLISAATPAAIEQEPELLAEVSRLTTAHAEAINSKGDPTKHMPVLRFDADRCHVTVPHEMNPSKPHWIQYLWVVAHHNGVGSDRILGIKQFAAAEDSAAELTVPVMPGSKVQAFAFCNDHGLWSSAVHETKSMVDSEL